jgi:hypothetical protein
MLPREGILVWDVQKQRKSDREDRGGGGMGRPVRLAPTMRAVGAAGAHVSQGCVLLLLLLLLLQCRHHEIADPLLRKMLRRLTMRKERR